MTEHYVIEKKLKQGEFSLGCHERSNIFVRNGSPVEDYHPSAEAADVSTGQCHSLPGNSQIQFWSLNLRW